MRIGELPIGVAPTRPVAQMAKMKEEKGEYPENRYCHSRYEPL